jgi:uncharacterized protein YbjT (DUF2867 family)
LEHFITKPFFLFFGKSAEDHKLQEMMLRESKLDYTIILPGLLTEGELTKNYKFGNIEEHPNMRVWKTISRKDIAHFAMRILSEDFKDKNL